MARVSVIINTLNEEKKIGRCISSVKGFANEVVVVDMMSSDRTREIAKNLKARIFKHKKVGFVEPARNFAISKAKYDWVFILDADEEMSDGLKSYLKKELKDPQANFYRIPRKNIIFGKWLRHSGWWPDFNIRFFKKGTVTWNEVIHSVPMTTGKGLDLPIDPTLTIKHRHYTSVEEYITRLNKYTTIQSKELNKKGVEFDWKQLVTKPLSEFLRRYFAEQGFKDGIHGLAVCLLQAFSELVVYIKLWQKQKFVKKKIKETDVFSLFYESSKDIDWWMYETKISRAKNIITKLWLKVVRKLKYQ